LERDLKTDYKDIEEVYRRQLIKVQTGKLANQDLEKYAVALDK
jgi:DNA repair protein RAD50